MGGLGGRSPPRLSGGVWGGGQPPQVKGYVNGPEWGSCCGPRILTSFCLYCPPLSVPFGAFGRVVGHASELVCNCSLTAMHVLTLHFAINAGAYGLF